MKKRYRNLLIVIIFAVAGLVVTLQFKSAGPDYRFITVKTMSDLQNAVKSEADQISHLKILIEAQKEKLRRYESALANDGSIQEILMQDIEELRVYNGFYDLGGPGVMVLLSDSERELFENEDPNNVIVHDADVLHIINDLKIAGAEALSINGQRLLHHSEIKCAGATITINQVTHAQPFVIKAIGNTDLLSAAVRAPSTYAWVLKEVYGLRVETHVSERVRIPRYSGQRNLQYISFEGGD